jgi:hypothetical protein
VEATLASCALKAEHSFGKGPTLQKENPNPASPLSDVLDRTLGRTDTRMLNGFSSRWRPRPVNFYGFNRGPSPDNPSDHGCKRGSSLRSMARFALRRGGMNSELTEEQRAFRTPAHDVACERVMLFARA